MQVNMVSALLDNEIKVSLYFCVFPNMKANIQYIFLKKNVTYIQLSSLNKYDEDNLILSLKAYRV